MTFYEEIFKLKQLVRRGWQIRKIPGRLESDAEHTFSMLILALEIIVNNNLGLDELKVIKMVAYHELCEIDAGDTIPNDNVPIEKQKEREYACIKRLARNYDLPQLESLWLEYEGNHTKEAQFVKKLDKFDAVLQSLIYSEEFKNYDWYNSFRTYSLTITNELNTLKASYLAPAVGKPKRSLYNEIYKLKKLIRRGWVLHGVPERVESDAEHTFSMMMLALEIFSKNNLGLDELKVLKMIAYHELCEIDAGDTTPMDKVPKDEKYKREHDCIKRLAKTYNMPEIEILWLEYENQTSEEGKFVEMLDRVDAILQAKIYSKNYKKPEIYKDFIHNAKDMYDKYKKLNNKKHFNH